MIISKSNNQTDLLKLVAKFEHFLYIYIYIYITETNFLISAPISSFLYLKAKKKKKKANAFSKESSTENKRKIFFGRLVLS